MSQKILYKLKAKNGTYKKDGEEKPAYVDCGVILQGEYGPYILFEKTFNPAGMETDPGRTGVFISMFKEEPRQAAPQQAARPTPPNVNFPEDDFEL